MYALDSESLTDLAYTVFIIFVELVCEKKLVVTLTEGIINVFI